MRNLQDFKCIGNYDISVNDLASASDGARIINLQLHLMLIVSVSDLAFERTKLENKGTSRARKAACLLCTKVPGEVRLFHGN